jgi:hypothetical protein
VKRTLSRAEELEIAICYLAGHPIKDISDRYSLSRSGVHRVVTRMGVETERGKKSA